VTTPDTKSNSETENPTARISPRNRPIEERKNANCGTRSALFETDYVDVFARMAPGTIAAFVSGGRFLDIGTPESLQEANSRANPRDFR